MFWNLGLRYIKIILTIDYLGLTCIDINTNNRVRQIKLNILKAIADRTKNHSECQWPNYLYTVIVIYLTLNVTMVSYLTLVSI